MTKDPFEKYVREQRFKSWLYGRLFWYAIAVASIAAFAYFIV